MGRVESVFVRVLPGRTFSGLCLFLHRCIKAKVRSDTREWVLTSSSTSQQGLIHISKIAAVAAAQVELMEMKSRELRNGRLAM